jgi:hypothetical protein
MKNSNEKFEFTCYGFISIKPERGNDLVNPNPVGNSQIQFKMDFL